MSTVNKVMKLFKGQYVRCDFLKPVGERYSWSGNDLRFIENPVPKEAEVLDYRLLNEFDYNMIFWAPIGESFSFEKEFGNKEAQILCIVLPRCGQFLFKRRKRIGGKVYALHMPAESFQESEAKADAAILLGIWHQYLDLKEPENARIYDEREAYYRRKVRYPEVKSLG